MSRSRDIANLLGSSSPIVDKSIIDAKGDLLIGSADNTVTKLAAGSTGQVPLVDSSTSSGLRYVDPPALRNLIINGACTVHQRGTSRTGISDDGIFTADRWNFVIDTLGTWTESVETDAPTDSGLRKSLKLLCTTADASPASGDVMYLEQKIEGQDLQRLKKGTASAEQLTVSFWVKSNVTGTYVVGLFDTDNIRYVASTYSVSASATWERKTVTFPADTTGALDNDNAGSLFLWFFQSAGSSYTSGTLATTWAAWNAANGVVGQTNLAAATNNYWQITGVQLETGPVATPFEFEPFETTLRKCQRYYTTIFSNNQSDFQRAVSRFSLTACSANYDLPVDMRIIPTIIATSNSPGVFGRIVGYDTNMNAGVASVSSIVTGTTENSRSVTLFFTHTSLSGSFVFASYDTLSAITTVAASAEL